MCAWTHGATVSVRSALDSDPLDDPEDLRCRKVNLDAYDLDAAIFDEMYGTDGTPRDHCRLLHETLSELSNDELGLIQERMARSFSEESTSFTVYGDEEAQERIIPVDCIPRVLTGTEWQQIETGLIQRLAALNRFLADVYGEARIVADGVIPADMVRGCPQYRIEMRDVTVPHGTWIAVCGTDIVRTIDGFKVLEDNLRLPDPIS